MRQSMGKRLAEPNTFEERIESFEQEARKKHCTAIQNMQAVELSDRFNRLLKRRIIPTNPPAPDTAPRHPCVIFSTFPIPIKSHVSSTVPRGKVSICLYK